MMKSCFVFLLFGGFAVSACAEKSPNFEATDKDAGAKDAGGPATDEDTGSDTGLDTGSEETETDTMPPPGGLGDPCWVSVLPSGHPNLGLDDCEPAYQCIGNNEEAWCSEKCLVIGTVSDAPDIAGWCCGDWGGDPCGAATYWLPDSMRGSHCAPRDIPQGQPCEIGGESRCVPLCSGTDETFRVTCAATSVDSGFCTHACERHSDCLDDPPFAEGCCGETMGATYCLPEISEACLPIT